MLSAREELGALTRDVPIGDPEVAGTPDVTFRIGSRFRTFHQVNPSDPAGGRITIVQGSGDQRRVVWSSEFDCKMTIAPTYPQLVMFVERFSRSEFLKALEDLGLARGDRRRPGTRPRATFRRVSRSGWGDWSRPRRSPRSGPCMRRSGPRGRPRRCDRPGPGLCEPGLALRVAVDGGLPGVPGPRPPVRAASGRPRPRCAVEPEGPGVRRGPHRPAPAGARRPQHGGQSRRGQGEPIVGPDDPGLQPLRRRDARQDHRVATRGSAAPLPPFPHPAALVGDLLG